MRGHFDVWKAEVRNNLDAEPTWVPADGSQKFWTLDEGETY